MRDKFPGHFRPKDAEYKTLWETSTFAVDANVILNLYRYSTATRLELEKSIRSIKDKIFIPNQAAKEFLKNRINVTFTQAGEYAKSIDTITKLKETLSDQKRHPFLENDQLSEFSSFVDLLIGNLKRQEDTLLARLKDDEILDFVEEIFTGKTGDPFSDEDVQRISAEGEQRYADKIPPGYKDESKDAAGDKYRKYGDLILWKQLINKAIESKESIIFITDDNKSDWWTQQSGKTIGPRSELRDEFQKATGKSFWIYTVDRFIEETAKITKTPVSETVIEEIQYVQRQVRSRIEHINYSPGEFNQINKADLLDRIKASEERARRMGHENIGLHFYVKNYLGRAGFDYSSSYDAIDELVRDGQVEIYDFETDRGYAEKSIRTKNIDQFVHRPLGALAKLIENSKGE